ncbi:MAG: response regulator transcription factor [Hungatella sp.]|nr:response regulator transcription factor [Hungatella sp.]
MATHQLLIIDDELAIRMALKTAFTREGMTTREASCGTEALALLAAQEFDLIVLDIMMQDMDGYAILQKLRSDGIMTPVLMLSGRQAETDQVLGLGLGADDYLTKPFHLAVLIQKAKALIRRNNVYSHQKPKGLVVGPFRFDTMKLECYKNDRLLKLTARELVLFRFFLEHPGQTFTKEQLYHQVWNEYVVDDNTIMVYIKRLREKIEDDSKKPAYLKTVRGIGYLFDGKT